MANLFLDLELGSDAAPGTSYANRVKTLARASALALPGDTVRIMANTTPNSLGTNGTFARGSPTITLAAAQNATIENGETAWTASANVVTTTSTNRKQGSFSTSIAPAAAFTTGLAAFKLITLADLSAYQQISFWFQQTAGTLSTFQIRICTDAVGAVAANTFTIPAAGGLSQWHRVTVNLGSAMSAAALSVALYVTVDNGAQTILLDNIVACKAPGTGELSHQTLIGKQNSFGAGGNDSEIWYAIRAIEGTVVTLENRNSSIITGTANGRYWGTSETITAYSLKPIYLAVGLTSTDQWIASGTPSDRIAISGGWNRTDMSSQPGVTVFGLSWPNANNPGITIVSSCIDLSQISFLEFIGTVQISGDSITTNMVNLLHCQAMAFSGIGWTVTSTLVGHTQLGMSGLSFSSVSCGQYTDQASANFSNANGCNVTMNSDSVFIGLICPSLFKFVFNGTTYGSFGEASTAAAVMASTGDTGVTLTKALEMLAAFKAGKVSVSSAAGVSTYTYKKRDGTTTSFTALCSETDGTRATTGALS